MSELPRRPARCARCGVELSPALLVCPACGTLVHAERLERLAAEAEVAEGGARLADAVAAWRHALELLPPTAPQVAPIQQRVDGLSLRLDASAGRSFAAAPKWLASLGLVGVLLWKFKFLLAFVLTKGKLLLLGLTKGSTFFSMLLAMGAYWTLWGWPFAVGFVVMIYVHEMGHVAALHALGIRASAPMFVPGLGAFVRLEQYPVSPREDARVGLAGPIWGLGAAVAAWALHGVTGAPILAAIARAGALVNLFNLIPVWQLDGARGLRALARRERIGLVVLIAAAFLVVRDGMLLLVGLGALARAFEKTAPERSDLRATTEFSLLVVALTLLATVPVPGFESN